MDEYSALAQRVAMTMDDVRGCLVLSRDGLVLGAFPEESEASMKSAWLRFVNVGEARRSFVEFGDQIWAYIFRGPYAAFVISGTSVRPGVLLDQLEMALLTAEESRQKRDTLRVPEAPSAPSGKPRTNLHPPAIDRPPAEVVAGPLPAEITVAAVAPQVTTPTVPPEIAASEPASPEPFRESPFVGLMREQAERAGEGPEEDPATPEPPTASSYPRAPQRLVGDVATEQPSDEIDRVMLAKEFGGLLQGHSDGDEASS